MWRESAAGLDALRDNLADVRNGAGERARARTRELSNSAPLATARFMPLSAGGINALLSLFSATQTLLNYVCVNRDVRDQYCLCVCVILKPMSGQEE